MGGGTRSQTSRFPYRSIPRVCPIFVGVYLFALFRLLTITQCCIIFPYLFRSPVYLSSSCLPGSRGYLFPHPLPPPQKKKLGLAKHLGEDIYINFRRTFVIVGCYRQKLGFSFTNATYFYLFSFSIPTWYPERLPLQLQFRPKQISKDITMYAIKSFFTRQGVVSHFSERSKRSCARNGWRTGLEKQRQRKKTIHLALKTKEVQIKSCRSTAETSGTGLVYLTCMNVAYKRSNYGVHREKWFEKCMWFSCSTLVPNTTPSVSLRVAAGLEGSYCACLFALFLQSTIQS